MNIDWQSGDFLLIVSYKHQVMRNLVLRVSIVHMLLGNPSQDENTKFLYAKFFVRNQNSFYDKIIPNKHRVITLDLLDRGFKKVQGV